jgi:pyruvate carboxylase
MIIEVKVKVGDVVKKGQPLLVLSAMKMETVVAAPKAGRIVSLPIAVGDNLAGNDLCAEIEE